jgi:hypothetical protein
MCHEPTPQPSAPATDFERLLEQVLGLLRRTRQRAEAAEAERDLLRARLHQVVGPRGAQVTP